MRVVYNSPTVLTLTLLAGLVLVASLTISPEITLKFCIAKGNAEWTSPTFYIGLFTYILGHASVAHYAGNFMIILLVGPLLEEKNGSKKMLIMILVTTITTSVLNTMFFSTGILGASGIAFMMLILASCANVRQREIPTTLILAVALHLGHELASLQNPDNISHFGHLLGGVCGAAFGLLWQKRKRRSAR